MSHAEIEAFFSTYVGWMRRDIEREIDIASSGRDAGNLLCALGLLVYTEALGRLRRATFDQANFQARDTEANFNDMFDRLDSHEYGRWRQQEWKAQFPTTSVYELLRCGLVHEYLPKVDSVIHMGAYEGRGVEIERGEVVFYVVPYYRHWDAEATQLLADLRQHPAPVFPPSYIKMPLATATGGTLGIVSGSSVASGSDPRAWPTDWRKPKS